MNPAADSIPVTVMVFTLNEELHLPSCLASLKGFDEVIVIDSFSTDKTAQVCRAAGARFLQNEFKGFGSQRNWALLHASPRNDWVLILDADERVAPELAMEISSAIRAAGPDVGAFRLKRRFYFWGRWLKYSSLYPTWVVRLIRRGRVRYENRGHAETQETDGTVLSLRNDLIDENLKGIDEWFERQNRYSTQEAEHELALEKMPLPIEDLCSRDPMKRRSALKRLAAAAPIRPLGYFVYSYVIRLGLLDGYDGLIFCLMKSIYQAMVAAKKHDLRKKRLSKGDPG